MKKLLSQEMRQHAHVRAKTFLLACASRTVARESSIRGLYVCLEGLYICVGGLDIQIWQKFHWFMVFHISICGGLELSLGG